MVCKGGSDLYKHFIRKSLLVLASVTALFCGVGVFYQYVENNHQREEQERLAQLAQQTTEAVIEIEMPESETELETTEAPYVSPIDFEALQAENPDVVGWIRIPDTKIDYPILQADDNDTYLHRDFDGRDSVHGAIFLDCDSESDFSGWNHPIYGHHMKDGSMFKDVVKFKDESFFREHQYFEIYTPEKTIHLKAIACYYSSSDGIVRQTKFKDQDDFDVWLSKRLEPCSYAQIPQTPVRSVFTLVTCSYEMKDARTLLFAIEAEK